MTAIPKPTRPSVVVEAMTPADWPDVSSIYLEGIRT
jgi:hypothetical protein